MLKRTVLICLVLGMVLFLFINPLVCDYDFRGTWVRECTETSNGTWMVRRHVRTTSCFGHTWQYEDRSMRETEFIPACGEPQGLEVKPGWLLARATGPWGPVCNYSVAVLAPSGKETIYLPDPGTNIIRIPIQEEGEHAVDFLHPRGGRVCACSLDLDPAKGATKGCYSDAWFAPWPNGDR